jgi:hypothetical protein
MAHKTGNLNTYSMQVTTTILQHLIFFFFFFSSSSSPFFGASARFRAIAFLLPGSATTEVLRSEKHLHRLSIYYQDTTRFD